MKEIVNENLIESVLERLNKNFQKDTILMHDESLDIYFDEFLGEYVYIKEFEGEISKSDVKSIYNNSFSYLKDKIYHRYESSKSDENFSKQSFIYVLIIAQSCDQKVYKFLNRLHSTQSHNFVIPLVYLRHSNEFVRFYKKPFFACVFCVIYLAISMGMAIFGL